MDFAAPRVEVRRSARRKRSVTAYRERDTIVVLVPQSMTRRDEQRYVAEMVEKVLAREARSAPPRGDAELAERATALLEQYLERQVGELRPLVSVGWVTNQSQRWGSCTPSAGTIRLSHRLQGMPAWVVDYVLLHELAHLAEPSHSDRFWTLVDAYPLAERAKGFLEGYLAGQARSGAGMPSAPPIADHSLGDHSLADHSLGDHSLADHSLGDHSLADHSLGDHSLGDHSLEDDVD
jgi:predicted metal-dependent hydrolase